MKKLFIVVATAMFACACSTSPNVNVTTPHFEQSGNKTQFIVNDEPFIMRGGELANSSASSTKYMRKNVWPIIKKMGLNTILSPVYWELIEPIENNFDFTSVNELINDAHKNNVKLVLLWFGAWKNSMSCYVPEWMKTDTARFQRVLSQNGEKQEIITPFSQELLNADEKAFKALLKNIKTIDKEQNTVIMIQVENEIAMLPNARDYSALAQKKFESAVPQQLIDYLTNNKETLTPHLKKYWNGATQGTWTELFGNNIYAEEIFQAWFYATYVDKLATAGKAVYNLPMYVNAALNRAGKLPGEYPSGGPIPNLIDIWKAGAPTLDMLSPDIYFSEFDYWTSPYFRTDNPVFIPEHQFDATVGAKALYAFGKLHALGFSPFSIENPRNKNNPENEEIAKCYNLISSITPLLNKYRGTEKMTGILLDKEKPSDTLQFGGYQLIAKHYNTLSWASNKNNDTWNMGGAVIISPNDGEYIVVGTGIVLTFKPLTENQKAGIISIDEVKYKKGKEILGRRLNGDEDHQGRHLAIGDESWEIQKVKLYTY